MDLQYSPEQLQLRDSVERFVRDEYDFARRRKLSATDPGHDEACWKQYADFGWLAVPFSEADGGIGGDATDTGIVMEGVGRGLLLDEPTEGLAPIIVEEMARDVVRTCSEKQVALLLCEQNIWFARRCTQHVVVIDTGRIVFDGGWDEFDRNPQIQQRYLAL